MDAAIAPCKRHETPAVLALLATCGLPTADVDEPLLAETLAARAADGALLGVAALEIHGPHALLRSLAVAPAARGAGLGRALVAAAEARARACGVRELYLLTTTARDFFVRLGWSEGPRDGVPPAIAATSEFARVCPDSAAMLRRRLDGGS